MNMVLRIMDRLARYLGLDKPQEKGPEGQTPGGLDITINFVGPDGTKLIDAEYERARAIRACPTCPQRSVSPRSCWAEIFGAIVPRAVARAC